jgi:hypothetical protein
MVDVKTCISASLLYDSPRPATNNVKPGKYMLKPETDKCLIKAKR